MTTSAKLMAGRKGLIMGVANDRSIAWGIAKALADHGAELAFTYQGDALLRRVTPLAQSVGSSLVMPCDVTNEESIDTVFSTIKDTPSWRARASSTAGASPSGSFGSRTPLLGRVHAPRAT